MFKPTHLYVKTHNVTGLKYFGKTTQDDPAKYKGSGKYWVRHLKTHGCDVSTEVIGTFTDIESCKCAANKFSNLHRITESVEWANLKDENGLDGGRSSGWSHTPESRKKMSESHIGKALSHDHKSKIAQAVKASMTQETRDKIRESSLARRHTDETKKRLSEISRSVSKESRMRAGEKHRGKIVSEETKMRMRESAKTRRKSVK